MSLRLLLTRYSSTLLISSIFLIILLIMAAPIAGAASVVMPRQVLLVYNSQHQLKPIQSNVVLHAFETVLEYHGLLPDYLDVSERPLPDAQAMQRYLGVITTMESVELPDPNSYFTWLHDQLQAKRKVIVLGAIGGSSRQQAIPAIKKKRDAVLARLGLKYSGKASTDRVTLRYAKKDKEMVEFEREFGRFPPYYDKYEAIDATVLTHLSIRMEDVPGSESPVVVTGPAGGFALEGFLCWRDPATNRQQWYLNPFLFVEKSFGLHGLPKPDPTTLNGRRVAISHIDGDGFGDVSKVDKQLTSAEIIRDRILGKYDFPTTVSVIAGQIDPQASGSEKLVNVARGIFSLPNVEAASHGYSLPADRDSEPQKEIDSSLRYISEQLAPPGKPCKLFFWSGDNLPNESDIARCDALGVNNLNGGETIFDDLDNSFTSVAPLYRKVGDRFQIHAGMASEDQLTNHWTEPLYGYRSIITTAQRTGFPFRLKPIDIYFHFHSGANHASLRAVQDVYEWTRAQPVALAYTSEYIRMVRGFLAATLKTDGPDRFIVEEYGDCLTVRFDDEQRVPDLIRSENVLGFSRQEQGLYVSLAPGAAKATLVMTAAPVKNLHPYVREAAGWVTGFLSDEKRIRLSYQGYGKGMIAIGGLPPKQSYNISGSGLPLSGSTLSANADGVLTVTGITSGDLEIERL